MKNKNTMGKTEFILKHILAAFIAMIWYKTLLFRCVSNLTLTQSMFCLCGFILFCTIVEIYLRFRNRRTAVGVALDIIIPYGIYTVLVYAKIWPELIIGVLIVAVILSAIYTMLIMGQKVKNRWRYKLILKRRMKRALISFQTVVAIGMAVIMVTFGINMFWGSTIMRAAPANVTMSISYAQNVSDNMDTVLKLKEEIWTGLSVQERLDVLQVIAQIERSYLGISSELIVGVANLDENILGYYNDGTHEIVINLESLLNDEVYEVLDTLCHEVYHSYQHRLADVYNSADANTQNLKLFKDLSSYVEELNDYKSGIEDYYTYYTQEIESDAREYAKYSVYDYYYIIFKYMEENSEAGST